MRKIAGEVLTRADLLHNAPHDGPVGRVDEVAAARHPNLRWTSGK